MADRVKHQVVKFTNGRARIYITDDISSITEDETTLINPDMSYVRGVAPEFWTLKDGKLWPEEDQAKIDEIKRNAAAISAPSDLKRIELAQRIEQNEKAIEAQTVAFKRAIAKIDEVLNAELEQINSSIDSSKAVLEERIALNKVNSNKDVDLLEEDMSKRIKYLSIALGLSFILHLVSFIVK
jgi:hypothetical protein